MAFLKEYENLGELGKVGGGSFAQVYKVRHNEFGYVRAVRLLKERITDRTGKIYTDFIRECEYLLRLGNGGHPNIVRIYQPRIIDFDAFWEMDYIEGQDVESFIKKNKGFMPVEEIKRFLLDIASALAYCHVDNYRFSLDRDKDCDWISIDPSDGSNLIISPENRQKLIKKYCVVHNDIKSNNIMRKYDGSYILLDFGLAFDKNKKLSRNSLMNNGGVEYKAPEKWDEDAAKMTERTDIYSFGILLYEVLTGRVPFPYDNNLSQEHANYEVSKHHKNTPPPAIEPLRRAACEATGKKWQRKDYPDWLEKVIMKCLEKKPEDRYANGKELYKEVKSLIDKDNKNTSGGAYIENLTEQNKFLATELSELAYENQQLKTQKSVIVETQVIKKVTKPFWVIIGVLFFLVSGALAFACYEIANETPVTYPADTKQISQLQQQISDKKVEVDKLNSQITSLKQQLSKSGNNSELQKIIDENDRNIADLKNQLATKQKSSSSITDLQKQITQLKADKTSLQNQLATAKNSGNSADLQQQINSLKQQIQEKDKISDKLNSQITSLKQQLSKSGNNSELQKIIAEKDKELTNLKNQLSATTTSITDLQKQITQLKADKTSLQNQLATAKNSGNSADLQQQINSLKQQIQEKDKTIAEQKAKIQSLINNI